MCDPKRIHLIQPESFRAVSSQLLGFFQERGDDAAPAEGQPGHGDSRDAEGIPQLGLRRRSDRHVYHRTALHVLHADPRPVRVRAVQETASTVHDVSGDRGSRAPGRTEVAQAVLQGLHVSTLFAIT